MEPGPQRQAGQDSGGPGARGPEPHSQAWLPLNPPGLPPAPLFRPPMAPSLPAVGKSHGAPWDPRAEAILPPLRPGPHFHSALCSLPCWVTPSPPLPGDCLAWEAFPGGPLALHPWGAPPSSHWVSHSVLCAGVQQTGQRPPMLSGALRPGPTRPTGKASPEPHMAGRAKGSN